MIGHPVEDMLIPVRGWLPTIGTALEWEVRVQGKPVDVHAEHDLPAKAVADIFPAYDDEEGGLLVVLTPANHR